MTWKSKSATAPTAAVKRAVVEHVRPAPKVYSDHLAILRSIQAPDDVIRIAEEVVAANAGSAAVGTKP